MNNQHQTIVDCRRQLFWQDDEVVQELREAALAKLSPNVQMRPLRNV